MTLLRAALTSYFEGRYRLELCIYGDPRLDLDDAEYTVKTYADREDWDDINLPNTVELQVCYSMVHMVHHFYI